MNTISEISNDSARNFLNHNNFKRSNTKVVSSPERTEMYLFGNLIAWIDRKGNPNIINLSHCGWLTPTTKSRLNAIIGPKIKQKDFEWYLSDKKWNGTKVKFNKQTGEVQ